MQRNIAAQKGFYVDSARLMDLAQSGSILSRTTSSGAAGFATAVSADAPNADEICSRFTGNRSPRLNNQEDTRLKWK